MIRSTQICNLLYQKARENNGENVDIVINGMPIFLVQRKEDADYVMRTNVANYDKHAKWLRQTLGPSRFSENGEAWKLRRDLSQAYLTRFDKDRVFGFAQQFAKEAIVKTAQASEQGAKTLDDDRFRTMTASVLVATFFGVNLADTRIDIMNIAKLMELGAQYSFVPPGCTHEMYREQLGMIPEIRAKILSDLHIFREGKLPENPMLQGMLEADATPDNGFTLEHELLAFLAAGAEATAATVGWMCYLLAKHPELQEQLRQSVKAIWKSDAAPDYTQLSQLEDVSRFISEALRMYPTSPISERIALGPDKIGEREIATGQDVMVSVIGIQHDERYVNNPWQLDMGEVEDRMGSKTAFMNGPRVCGGKLFALTELTSVLSVFLMNARFELMDTSEPVFYWKLQLLREGGHPVKVTLL